MRVSHSHFDDYFLTILTMRGIVRIFCKEILYNQISVQINKENEMILLCWTTKRDDGMFVDHYTTFETPSDARLAYDRIIGDDSVYSASLCKPFVSTEPHYLD